MKILHVITGLENGGAEAVLSRLIEADPCNVHHVVSMMNRGRYADEIENAGASVTTLDFPQRRVTFVGLMRLFRIIRQFNPDVIQTWMYHADLVGGMVARLAGVKAICWGVRHANLDSAFNRFSTLAVVWLCARLSHWIPRKIISCSAYATRLHQTAGYSKDKFVHIPNGYHLGHLYQDIESRDKIRSRLGIPAGTFVLGCIARFDVQKDHNNLINALHLFRNQVPSFICVMAGSGVDDENTTLLQWIDAAGVKSHIRLLGTRSDIPAIMNAIDVHVLPSLGEAFPNVLAEAMACGTPCVATDVGDAALIVDVHGWVVPPKNASALAQGLVHAYEAFALGGRQWESRQAACRAHIVTNFELQRMCEHYRRVWLECALPKNL